MARTTRGSRDEPTPAEARRALVGELRAALTELHGRVEASAKRQSDDAAATERILKSHDVKRAEEADPALAEENRAIAKAARARKEQARELRDLAKVVHKQIARDLDDLARTLLG